MKEENPEPPIRRRVSDLRLQPSSLRLQPPSFSLQPSAFLLPPPSLAMPKASRSTPTARPARPARGAKKVLAPELAAELADSAAPGAALLAVDLQSSLLGALPAATARALRARAGLALAAATSLHIPVLFSEQVPAKLGPTDPELRKLAPGAPVFGKNCFSAVSDPHLLTALRDRRVEHLILVGLETPICIYQTALDALAERFQVTILSDAVAARRADDHATCLSALRHTGVHVLPVETVFYALLHDASHPLFKTFTGLVKQA